MHQMRSFLTTGYNNTTISTGRYLANFHVSVLAIAARCAVKKQLESSRNDLISQLTGTVAGKGLPLMNEAIK